MKGNPMSVAKHIEITADSTKSFEDAVQQGIATASKTVKGIRSAWVKDQQVLVEGNKVTTYRVNMKVTFVLEA
jgi:flavin-binding protein dodecin